jgi:hypothetical protein
MLRELQSTEHAVPKKQTSIAKKIENLTAHHFHE